jgi:hypothetical protein
MSASNEVTVAGERRAGFVWRRVLIALVVLVAVLVALGFIRQRLGGGTLSERLQALIDDLDASDPNWCLADLEAAREKVPEKDNSARVIVKVVGLLPRPWPPKTIEDKLRDLDRVPTAGLDQGQMALLDKELTTHATALAEARKLIAMPRGRHRLAIDVNPIVTSVADQEDSRRVGILLGYDALVRVQNGDVSGALGSCRASLNAARALSDEPFKICQLFRLLMIATPCSWIERALAQGEASDADLAAVQQLLAEEEKHPTLLIALRGERATLDDLMAKLENGTIQEKTLWSLGGFARMPDADLMTRLFGLSRHTIRRERARCLELTTRLIEIAQLPKHEQEAELGNFEAAFAALPAEAALTRVLFPSPGSFCEQCQRKTAQVRSLLVLMAVERYRLKRGKWPDKLDDLKPEFLSVIPNDPYDGKSLRYVKRADGVTVYSIGPDGSDNGGKIDRSNPAGPGVDEGYRLWDVKARRQPPRPAPPPVGK